MGNIELFKLLGSILVNNSEANKNIEETDSKAKTLGERLGGGIKTAAKWGAALTGAAAGAGAALFGIAKKSADATDRIDKLSQKIGISRKGFQELEYVLSQNGTDIEKLQVGLKSLTQRMGEAVEGTGEGAKAFETLNLSAVDLNGNLKTQEVMFEDAAKALMQLPAGAEKSQLAFDLFGKAGLELMPMLNGSADGFDQLKQAANDMGLVLGDDAVDAGATFTDTMDNVKRSLGAVMANVGTQVMPLFQKFLDWIMDHMPEIQKVVGIVFEKIGEFVEIAVKIFTDHLMPIFEAVFKWVKDNWPTIQAIIEGVFKAIKFVWDNVLAPVLKILWDTLKAVVDWVSDNWGTISAIFETTFKVIAWIWNNTLGPVLTLLWDILKGIVTFVADKFGAMKKTFENTFDGIGKAVSKVADVFGWLTDKISSAWNWLTKWNKTDVKDKDTSTGGVQGSHAGGLERVPFDGYRAILHKDEAVLTAKENEAYLSGRNTDEATGDNISLNVGVLVADDTGLRKLERMLRDIRRAEDERLGVLT